MVWWSVVLWTLTGLLFQLSDGSECLLFPLYPYGTPRGDVKYFGDDISYTYFPSSPILYYEDYRDSLHVSTNGVLAFDERESNYLPEDGPTDIAHIASFWNDANLNLHGQVYFREVNLNTEIDIVCLVERDAESIGLVTFTPDLIFIVTWHEAAPINGSESGPTATHQIVLATNGTVTIAVINFGWIGWSFQKSLFGEGHAGLSFNKGDDLNFLEFDGISRTSNMLNIGTMSNEETNFPGRIVLRVDNDITLPVLTTADCTHCTVDWTTTGVTTFDGSTDYAMSIPDSKFLFAKQQQTLGGTVISGLDQCKFMSRFATNGYGELLWFAFSGGLHSNIQKYKRSFTVHKGVPGKVSYRGQGMSGSQTITSFPHFETTFVDYDDCLTFSINKNDERIMISSPSCKYTIIYDYVTDEVTLSLGDLYDGKTIGICQNNNGDANDDKLTCNPPADVSSDAGFVDAVEDDCSCDLNNKTCNAALQGQ